MSQVQIHNFDDDGVNSTNTIYLNYTLSCTRNFSATSDTLTLNFSNMFLKMTSHSYYDFWLGVWPKIVFKNGNTVVHTHNPARKTARTGDNYSIYPDINKDSAIFLKPLTDGNWTSVKVNAGTDDEETYRRYPATGTSSDSVTINLYAIDAVKNLTNEQRANLDMELYFVADSFDAWWNTTDKPPVAAISGCRCPAHQTGKNTTAKIESYTGLTVGSVDVVDNGNNTITITGTNAQRGINNNIASSTLNIDFNAGTDPADKNVGTTSRSSFSYGDKDPATDIINIPSGATNVTVTLTSTGVKGDTVTAIVAAKAVKYYVAPTWGSTTNLTFTSGDLGQYNNRPRLKKPLKWAWTGAEAGNTEDHNVIRGYQIYICNGGGGTDKAVGLYPYRGKFTLNSGNTSPGAKVFETSTESSDGAYKYVINRGTTNHALVTDGSGNISFTPIDLKFASKNICYCRVRPFSYWGNRVATKEIGSDGNKETYDQYAKNYGPWLIGICTADGSDTTATYIKGTQCVLSNGATVWVRVDTNGDGTPDTWKEGTVYVYNGTTWQEAEGVYVHDGSSWKESN